MWKLLHAFAQVWSVPFPKPMESRTVCLIDSQLWIYVVAWCFWLINLIFFNIQIPFSWSQSHTFVELLCFEELIYWQRRDLHLLFYLNQWIEEWLDEYISVEKSKKLYWKWNLFWGNTEFIGTYLITAAYGFEGKKKPTKKNPIKKDPQERAKNLKNFWIGVACLMRAKRISCLVRDIWQN